MIKLFISLKNILYRTYQVIAGVLYFIIQTNYTDQGCDKFAGGETVESAGKPLSPQRTTQQ